MIVSQSSTRAVWCNLDDDGRYVSAETPSVSPDFRLLESKCLACLGENEDAQSHQNLDWCRTLHKEVAKQCKYCPLWHHGCLTTLGSEEFQKCNWCNSRVELGNPEVTLPLQSDVAIGTVSLAKYKTLMDPTEFYVHSSILATRMKEEWSYPTPFTVDSQAKVVLTFPPEGFFRGLAKESFRGG
jgi:hypothetical protein